MFRLKAKPVEREAPTTPLWGTAALVSRREARQALQAKVAPRRDQWIARNRYFYEAIKRLLRFIIEPKSRVLQMRSETGHFLAAVDPSYGVGVEVSPELVELARQKHPDLNFVCGNPEDAEVEGEFDYILASHIFDVEDIQTSLERLRTYCNSSTRLLLINYNQLWEPLLELASKIGLRTPCIEPNWVSDEDIRGFLRLAGFRHLRTHRLLLFPKYIPLVSWFLNSFLAKLPGFRLLCMVQVIVARPEPSPREEQEVSVSVIVPCRNERGNIQPAVERIPEMGKGTEIIFCDDKSTDGTADEVRAMQEVYSHRNIRLVEGPAICKAENVWTGFRAARGDVLMILDADLTVMPEELPFFFRALVQGKGEFINGGRLIYPLPPTSMKFFNRIGNKVFGLVFSYLLSQRFKDTLCGTKVLWRKDWYRIEKNLGMWGIRDLWGDYELIFGASKLHLETVEVPVHYQERVYGVTKMTRVLANGVRMLRICRGAWNTLHG